MLVVQKIENAILKFSDALNFDFDSSLQFFKAEIYLNSKTEPLKLRKNINFQTCTMQKLVSHK